MFYYFEERYKKLVFLQFWNCKRLRFWNCKKIEFMKRFYKQLFYSFKTAKNCLWERRFHISWIYCHCHCHCLKKLISSVKKKLARSEKEMLFLSCFQNPFLCSFDTPKKRGFKTATMPAFWNSRLQPQKDVVVCINGFFDVLKLLHTRSFDTSFPYLGR